MLGKRTESPRHYARAPRVVVNGAEFKVCVCGARFGVEFNTRGQMTSRKLCDACRTARVHGYDRTAGPLQGVPADAPRCRECDALVGLQWGTVTHLDASGRCVSCARWEVKRMERLSATQMVALVRRLERRVNDLETRLVDVEARPAPTAPVEAVFAMPEPVAAEGPTDVEIARAALAVDRLARDSGFEGIAEVQGANRYAELAALRHGVVHALRDLGWIVVLIGGFLNRHHTTVLASLQRETREIERWRTLYLETLAQTDAPPEASAVTVAAPIRQRVVIENALRDNWTRGAKGMNVAGPPGHLQPSVLARRWGVQASVVRYWIMMGRLPAVKGEDGRWWLPENVKRPVGSEVA